MGVEYRHFLLVNDSNWIPQADTAGRIDAVLRKWELVDKPPQVINLAGGQQRLLRIDQLHESPGPGIALMYPGIVGPPVERLAGRSLFDCSPDERYTSGISLILGNDYRVQWSGDGFWFELTAPPTEAGKSIQSYQDEDNLKTLFAESFPSGPNTSPPSIKIHIQDFARPHIAWKGLLGYWRGALVIDLGKDLPIFAEEKHAIPSCAFVADVSEAFRGQIEEFGEFY